jgi:hypothetical protein
MSNTLFVLQATCIHVVATHEHDREACMSGTVVPSGSHPETSFVWISCLSTVQVLDVPSPSQAGAQLLGLINDLGQPRVHHRYPW